MSKTERIALWALLLVGIALRFTDVTVPDISTDEAQFLLGASNAHPSVGLLAFQMIIKLLGANVFTARLLSMLLGCASLYLLWKIVEEIGLQKQALLIVTLASLLPSHIAFSRLAYLTIPQLFTWLLALLFFLQAKKNPTHKAVLLCFVSCVLCTMIKTQGLLLPGVFLLGYSIEKRGKIKNDTLFWALFCSLIPIALYLATQPKIAATIFSMTSGSDPTVSMGGGRLSELIGSWILHLRWYILAFLVSLPWLRKLPWPVMCLALIGTGIGYILGPSHGYYAANLFLLVLPLGMFLHQLGPILRTNILALLCITTILITGPRALVQGSNWHLPYFNQIGYWNQHADRVNALLEDQHEVIVTGRTGHHLRWYLKPRVLVGNGMDIEGKEVLFENEEVTLFSF